MQRGAIIAIAIAIIVRIRDEAVNRFEYMT